MRLIHEYITYFRYLWRIKTNKSLSNFMKELKILSSEETVARIINENLSVSRYGDGEFKLMSGLKNGFQNENSMLAARLKDVLHEPIDGLLLCIPMTLKDWSYCRFKSKLSAAGYFVSFANPVLKTNLIFKYTYGDSLFTRFYMMRKDKSDCLVYAKNLKKIWNNKDLLIVEGKYSRLGVGNDLFDNAKSIKRILCPNFNAFDKYDEILKKTKDFSDGKLVVLALGMTATVLAYDLCKAGIRALDLGHIDIEYQWMLMGAREKCPVPNKQMSEVDGGMCEDDSHDPTYLSQIIDEVV